MSFIHIAPWFDQAICNQDLRTAEFWYLDHFIKRADWIAALARVISNDNEKYFETTTITISCILEQGRWRLPGIDSRRQTFLSNNSRSRRFTMFHHVITNKPSVFSCLYKDLTINIHKYYSEILILYTLEPGNSLHWSSSCNQILYNAKPWSQRETFTLRLETGNLRKKLSNYPQINIHLITVVHISLNIHREPRVSGIWASETIDL